MEAKDLKELADTHGIEYKKNANKAQMEKILKENDIYVGADPAIPGQDKSVGMPSKESNEDAPSYTNFDHELKQVIALHKASTTALELKRADQQRHILRTKIQKEGNEDALLKLLRWELKYKLITVADEYLLNSIEKDLCTQECLCATRIPASGAHTQDGKVYPFKTYYDESRECDVYVVFVDRRIAPEDQIDQGLAWKMSQGFMPEEKDYKPERYVWHRLAIIESQFRKYFKVEGEEQVTI